MHRDWVRIWIKTEDQHHFEHLTRLQSCPLSGEKKKVLKHHIVLKWGKKMGLSIDLNSHLCCLYRHLAEFHASPVKLLSSADTETYSVLFQLEVAPPQCVPAQGGGKPNKTKHFSTSLLSRVRSHLDLTKHPSKGRQENKHWHRHSPPKSSEVSTYPKTNRTSTQHRGVLHDHTQPPS